MSYSFQVYILQFTFVETIRRNRATFEETDKEIEDGAKEWLIFAGDRDGGRTRKEKTLLKNNENDNETNVKKQNQ